MLDYEYNYQHEYEAVTEAIAFSPLCSGVIDITKFSKERKEEIEAYCHDDKHILASSDPGSLAFKKTFAAFGMIKILFFLSLSHLYRFAIIDLIHCKYEDSSSFSLILYPCLYRLCRSNCLSITCLYKPESSATSSHQGQNKKILNPKIQGFKKIQYQMISVCPYFF